MLNCSSVGCLIFKAEKKFETPERRYMNSSHPEIGSGGFCMDTKKNAEQVKKRQDFDWFLLVTCCCLTLMSSSETQGQLEGAGKKLGRRKVKNAKKSPWGQSFNGPVPKRQGSSGF